MSRCHDTSDPLHIYLTIGSWLVRARRVIDARGRLLSTREAKESHMAIADCDKACISMASLRHQGVSIGLWSTLMTLANCLAEIA